MQHRALPSVEDRLSFDLVVPKMTSTRHVAAAAFYHCLGEQGVLRPVVTNVNVLLSSFSDEGSYSAGTSGDLWTCFDQDHLSTRRLSCIIVQSQSILKQMITR